MEAFSTNITTLEDQRDMKGLYITPTRFLVRIVVKMEVMQDHAMAAMA